MNNSRIDDTRIDDTRIDDNRILYFTNKTIRLPTEFVDVNPKQMIYAAGDGLGGFDKKEVKKTNIEIFTQLGFNIFVCVEYEKKIYNIFEKILN